MMSQLAGWLKALRGRKWSLGLLLRSGWFDLTLSLNRQLPLHHAVMK